MAKYVDGFVIPIKKKNVKDYKKMARIGCKVWMEHGALDYYECEGAKLDNEYRAFSNPAAKATWLPPFGFICNVESFDFKVGGTWRPKTEASDLNLKLFTMKSSL